MEWLEVKIDVTHAASEAVANLLIEAGSKGVEIEDPQLINDLRASGTWELCDIPEQTHVDRVTINAYYDADSEVRQHIAGIEAELKLLEERIGRCILAPIRFRKVSEQDWANEWKQYFHVTHVGRSLVIKPSWENYVAASEEKIIHIDPGMAFGTGTHHTTNMCMEFLEEIVAPGMNVFDVGTGSGILAIAAALLGAGKVSAVDIDPTAVRIAKENIFANKLAKRVEVKQGDLLSTTQGEADVIIANIIADVIIVLLSDVSVKLKVGGKFLTSGIIDEREEDVLREAARYGLKLETEKHRGGWAALVLSKEK